MTDIITVKCKDRKFRIWSTDKSIEVLRIHEDIGEDMDDVIGIPRENLTEFIEALIKLDSESK